jgi:hypothetical protein
MTEQLARRLFRCNTADRPREEVINVERQVAAMLLRAAYRQEESLFRENGLVDLWPGQVVIVNLIKRVHVVRSLL